MDILKKIHEASAAVRITWNGWFSEGKVKYSKSTAIKELINNVLVKLQWVKNNGRKIRIQFVFDTKSKLLTITDNFVGFSNPVENLRKAMDLGMSFKSPAILSEHGRGLKTAVNFWGKLKSIITTNDGDDFYELYPDYKSEVAAFATLKGKPFRWFDHKSWVFKSHPEFSTGTQIKIDLKSSQIAKQVNWFTNIIQDLEAAYFEYLGETLEVELVWIKQDGSVESFIANRKPILLSSSIAIEGHIDKKSGYTVQPKLQDDGTPYEYLDKAHHIGPDMWDFDGTYTHTSGIVVQYKIGRVPNPKNLEAYYKESGDNDYNPTDYGNSPFRYGSKYVGLSYCKKWVPISWAGFKQKRDGMEIFGFINVLEGIDTVATKDGVVSTSDLEQFEKDFSDFLSKRGVYVRGQADSQKIAESVMESNLLDKLKTSSKLRKYLGIDTRDFDNQYPLTSGYPDIVPLDEITKEIVHCVFELKKSGKESLWKASIQGMAYALEAGVETVFLVSLFEPSEFPLDLRRKLDIIEQRLLKSRIVLIFRYEQYQYLMKL